MVSVNIHSPFNFEGCMTWDGFKSLTCYIKTTPSIVHFFRASQQSIFTLGQRQYILDFQKPSALPAGCPILTPIIWPLFLPLISLVGRVVSVLR